MIRRDTIIDALHLALVPLPFYHALWLEGADGTGTVDEYSDIQIWADVEDSDLRLAVDMAEKTMAELAELEAGYIVHTDNPKVFQRIYRLKGTSPYLDIQFNWQLHSRPAAESTFIIGDPVEGTKILFDKSGVIRFKVYNAADYTKIHQSLLGECRFRFSQIHQILKWIERGNTLEADAAYNFYVLAPLVVALRLVYTPAHPDIGYANISRHLPAAELKKLDAVVRVATLDGMRRSIPYAVEWYKELEKQYQKSMVSE